MPQDSAVQTKILDAAQRRMLKFGYRKVSMDEIAADLGMSKNTIYKQFSGKEDIAKYLVKRLQQRINTHLDNIEKTHKDPLKVFAQSIASLRKELGPWFDEFFKDIPAELPELWDEFLRYRNEKILGMRTLVEKGVKKGVLRNVNQAIAVQAYLGAVKAIVAPKFLEEENITFDQALDAVLDIWSNGIIKRKA